MDAATSTWLKEQLGIMPREPGLFQRALTHPSRGAEDYERLEFLGDRVLGVIVALWLYELFPKEAEGKLSPRLNALVAGETCAEVARSLSVGAHVVLGKQARDDGAADSDNVLGDVMEALIGALYLDAGLEVATRFVRTAWGDRVSTHDRAPQHPKSALQEWAAANDKKPPVYQLAARKGPHHAPLFIVEVEISGAGSATGEGGSKQEAETAAATALLGQLR
jgi:ribonuclease-3